MSALLRTAVIANPSTYEIINPHDFGCAFAPLLLLSTLRLMRTLSDALHLNQLKNYRMARYQISH